MTDTKMAAHTQGPWEIESDWTICTGVGKQRKVICAIRNMIAADGSTPDASLIAAAPDLLEACREVADDLTFPYTDKAKQELLLKIKAAIKKAEGL